MNIVYVLPVKGGGGGAHSVAQEVNQLIKMGLNVKIAVDTKNFPTFVTTYSDMPNVSRNVIEFSDDKALASKLENCDVVVCTIFVSVKLVKNALSHIKSAKPKVTYYAQDYEPLFALPDDPLWQEAFDSYKLMPNMTVFAKTDWIRNVINANHHIEVAKVKPSIDHDVYFPGLDKSSSQIWISAMVRPSTPRRAPYRTMKILKQLADVYGDKVNINIFGCTEESLYESGLPIDFKFHNHGVLRRFQVSSLLRKSHLFIDFSDYQAFGRTGLEAMACGCVPLVPSLGGTDEYIQHNINGYAVDPRDERKVFETIEEFIALSPVDRTQLQFECIDTAQNFSVRKAAISEVQLFQKIIA